MNPNDTSDHDRWARFRFSVVGGLLAAPPPRGELREALQLLAERTWVHPTTKVPTKFGFSTIEGWYYRALRNVDPVRALRQKVRSDAGTFPALPESLREVLRAQWEDHRRWTMKLHYDNLGALVRKTPSLGTLPSYSMVCRYLRQLEREFAVAVLLVHHARKGGATRPGQALRGSSELHAWGDSNLYLQRRGEVSWLTVEHRAAPSPTPMAVALTERAGGVSMTLVAAPAQAEAKRAPPARRRVLDALAAEPRTVRDLRERSCGRGGTSCAQVAMSRTRC